jgi:hypothetical protein
VDVPVTPLTAAERQASLAQRLRTLAKVAEATDGRINVESETLHEAADAVLALAAVEKERDEARRAIEAVRALHRSTGYQLSDAMSYVCDFDGESWPCPTVALLPQPDVQEADNSGTDPRCSYCGMYPVHDPSCPHAHRRTVARP